MRCPTCGKTAKKVKSKKYPNWFYCNNPSCNRTVFEAETGVTPRLPIGTDEARDSTLTKE